MTSTIGATDQDFKNLQDFKTKANTKQLIFAIKTLQQELENRRG